MRMLLSMYESHGDVEAMAGLAVESRAFRAQEQVCALPNFAELLTRVGVLLPTGAWR